MKANVELIYLRCMEKCEGSILLLQLDKHLLFSAAQTYTTESLHMFYEHICEHFVSAVFQVESRQQL